jgi:hypothetical protein
MVKRFPILFGRCMNDEDNLIQDLLLWISSYTSVQVAIGVKIVDGQLPETFLSLFACSESSNLICNRMLEFSLRTSPAKC